MYSPLPGGRGKQTQLGQTASPSSDENQQYPNCDTAARAEGQKNRNIMNTQQINFHLRKLGEDQPFLGTILDIKIYIGKYIRTFNVS